MKFSTILTFAIATYTATTLTSAQSFQQRNADEAERLTEEFAKLTPNSPCTNNQQACVQDKFAQCVGGKFALTTCAGGLKCVVLPLVNKEGTSITCSTEEDRQKRLENARNAGKAPGKAPAKSILPDDGNAKKGKENESPKENPKENEPPKEPKENEPPKENPKENEPPKEPKENEPPKEPKENDPKEPKGKENDNDMPPKKPKEIDDEMPPEKPKEDDGKKPKENDGKKPKENDGKKPKENDGKKPEENDPKNPGNDDDVPPEEEPKTPPQPPAKKPDDELAAIRRQNADDAEDLQESFKSLTPDSDCEQNQIACVNEQIAQCDNGKFALRECGQGLICTALPLVLKRGTTVTCTTAEDRDNRLNEARNNLKK